MDYSGPFAEYKAINGRLAFLSNFSNGSKNGEVKQLNNFVILTDWLVSYHGHYPHNTKLKK